MSQAPTAYAGIGSRETPAKILELMTILGARLAERGHILRSGAASGADTAFEQGCDQARGAKEIYIPWQGFNGRMSSEPGVYCLHSQAAHDLAAEIHPNWAACSKGARALHERNCYQILGARLDSPVSDVVCWTPNGSGSGGTGQAIRLARKLGIPVWDLGNQETYLRFREMLGLTTNNT